MAVITVYFRGLIHLCDVILDAERKQTFYNRQDNVQSESYLRISSIQRAQY